MRRFLLALGIGGAVIPDDPEALVGLYRSVLAGKRLLLVLDNVSEADEVAALLPGSRECSVIVTSRNRLTSLVVSHDASLVSLDMLDDAESSALLAARLGSRRAEAEPEAIVQLVTACGGLPLALSITVGRAQEHPDFPLESFAAELLDTGSALNLLDTDSNLSIRGVLSAS